MLARRGATLTDAGERFRDGVATGLAVIRRGAAEAAELSSPETGSQRLFLRGVPLPRHAVLRRPPAGARRGIALVAMIVVGLLLNAVILFGLILPDAIRIAGMGG